MIEIIKYKDCIILYCEIKYFTGNKKWWVWKINIMLIIILDIIDEETARWAYEQFSKICDNEIHQTDLGIVLWKDTFANSKAEYLFENLIGQKKFGELRKQYNNLLCISALSEIYHQKKYENKWNFI